ncbi:MAG: SOS response-associated peptidase [Chloroflexota bacterium]|nr:SOS response-associated peptidase [Chloroflexota bacterium]
MCGRYTLRTPVDTLAERFEIDDTPSSIAASYNVAPTQGVATVLVEGGKRKLEMLHWGLIPSWADDPSIGNKMINARAETVAEKPSFRKAFRNHRCLVLADGFYEWQKTANGKQPYYIRMEDDSPFAFAGLWERWKNGSEVRSATIITTDANDIVAPIHNRMPVILHPEDYGLWLDPDFDEKEPLTTLLKPYPAEAMEAYPVSRRVNSPSNNEPSCIEAVA